MELKFNFWAIMNHWYIWTIQKYRIKGEAWEPENTIPTEKDAGRAEKACANKATILAQLQVWWAGQNSCKLLWHTCWSTSKMFDPSYSVQFKGDAMKYYWNVCKPLALRKVITNCLKSSPFYHSGIEQLGIILVHFSLSLRECIHAFVLWLFYCSNNK